MSEFRLREETLTLVLDEGDYAGVEATVRLPRNIGLYWKVDRLIPKREGETDEERDARLEAIYEAFATEVLVSWNVHDHAGPVPVTPDGVARVDPELLAEIFFLWKTSVREVPPPLAQPSPDTAHSGRRKGSKRRRS